MNARSNKVDASLRKLFKSLTTAGLINENEVYQYWYNPDFNFDPIVAQAQAHKNKLAETNRVVAEKYDAYDVATTWNPFRGLHVIGLIFQQDLKAGHPALEFCNRKTDKVYDYDSSGHTMFAAKPNRRTARGRELHMDLQKLSEEAGPLVEVTDFILDEIGLFQQAGTFNDNGITRVVPVRVWPLAMGLFIRTTKERLYDIPEGFTRIPQCAMVMAQEVEALIDKE